MHAQDGSRNRLELATSQPDVTPTPGIRCELPSVEKAMPLPLPCIPGVLPHIEWLALALQHALLGG